jgi:hypothetical protein
MLTPLRCAKPGLYADRWCWSGTNTKTGRTGVFPQTHVLLETLRQEASAKDKGKKAGRGLFGSRRPPTGTSSGSSISGGVSGRVSAMS